MISGPSLLWIFFILATAYTYDDLLVAVGNQIEILTNGSRSSPLILESYNASVLVALAYDPSTQKLFFSDRRNHRGHVFSVHFDGVKTQGLVQDVVEKSSNQSVEALTYDSAEQSLFWTDGLKRSIHRIVVDSENVHVVENNTIALVHLLEEDKPRGLVSDPCRRMIYWTNWNIIRPTIERSYINGSHREIIVQEGLLMPHGLGIDVDEQMIYWANNVRHGTFQIERSKVDGSKREILYEGKGHQLRGQFVFGLTVGERHVYWTDWDQKTLWSLPKDHSLEEPIALRSFQHKPMAVIVFQRHPITCPSATTINTHELVEYKMEDSFSNEEKGDNPITIISDGHSTDVQQTSTTVTTDIETDICAGYCFNGGTCYLSGTEMNCSCPENVSGDRCELYHGSATSNASSSCDDVYFATSASNNIVFVALISLSVMCVILVIAVVYLSFRVWRLSASRPRFKRRVLKQDKRYTNERVINIEDCCNMNICETPCTDPPSGATIPGHPSDRVKLLNCQF